MSEWVYATSGTPVRNTDGEISLPRERIIRCRDCKHSNTLATAPGVVVRCCYMSKLGIPRVVGDDGFCAWAERREEDGTR